MNYLCHSHVGCSAFFPPRLAKAPDTEKVYWYCRDYKLSKLNQNMQFVEGWEKFEIVKDFWKIVNETPKNNLIIIFDDNGEGEMADRLREMGYAVVGGSKFADKLENDRWYSIRLVKKIMDVPETEYFETWKEGLTFLKAKEKSERWVFKPQDMDVPKDKTYVSKDIPDLISAMENFRDNWEWDETYILQKFIEGPISSFNCYFDGKKWLPNSFGWYLENKPLMAGDIGPATGGEIAVQVFRKNEGAIFEILDKMTPWLQKYNYHGQMDINAIFSEQDHKPYFLEFTPRFGYPGIDLETTLLEENGKTLADLIKQLAFGAKEPLFPTNKVAVIVSVGIPPYPSEDVEGKLSEGLPVKWSKEYDRYFFPYGIMYDIKKKKMVTILPHVLHVTCTDQTLDGAVSMLYDTYIPTLELKDKQYRNDLGKDAKERLRKLMDFKVLT